VTNDEVPPGKSVFTNPQQHLHVETGYYTGLGMPAVLRLGSTIQFAESGPFYGLVLTFLSATAGMGAVFNVGNKYPDFHQDANGWYAGTVREKTEIDLPLVVRLIRDGALRSTDAVINLSRMLAITAWDAYSDWEHYQWNHPTGQFLRHIRHASAHKNRWHFVNGEPKWDAEWHGIKLTPDRHDNPCIGADILPGDLLVLLTELERIGHVDGPTKVLDPPR
jgi:hypothetical protein